MPSFNGAFFFAVSVVDEDLLGSETGGFLGWVPKYRKSGEETYGKKDLQVEVHKLKELLFE
ncbi:hypothetical protein QJS10_CPB21g00291 [Acorus calamus]|uniref:Uncharacterized protein n=1 Tax=Acorus calamus TaxID=4465 RepID=A0AAV9C4G6_ACOCL|nr:hypothetical protein QJS10_CPB21g00291 [Acorus calamus]